MAAVPGVVSVFGLAYLFSDQVERLLADVRRVEAWLAVAASDYAVTEPLEGPDGFPSRDDGKAGRHRVTTTLPTRTLEGSGMTSPWACMSSQAQLDGFTNIVQRPVDGVALRVSSPEETGTS